jgi:hypothetical protein
MAAAMPTRESCTTMPAPRLHAHLGGDIEELIGRRLAFAHAARRKQMRLEELDQVGAIQANADAVER